MGRIEYLTTEIAIVLLWISLILTAAFLGQLFSPLPVDAVILISFGLWFGCSLVASALRWHDLGCSGWAALLAIIPIVSIIAAIGLLCVPGTDGPNQFGPEPPIRIAVYSQLRDLFRQRRLASQAAHLAGK